MDLSGNPGGNYSSSKIMVAGPYQGAVGFTVFTWLLPYIEEQGLYDGAYVTNPPDTNQSGGLQYHVVRKYQCSSDPSPSLTSGLGATTIGGANGWGTGNYSANYLVFGNPVAQNTEGAARLPASIPDGLSNTVFYSERYGTCGTGGNPEAGSGVFCNLWGDSNMTWRPAFCINNTSQDPSQTPAWQPCALFQVTPDWIINCNAAVAESPHAGGINVCLGDGSVKFVSSGIAAATWAAVCDPRDGVPPGEGW